MSSNRTLKTCVIYIAKFKVGGPFVPLDPPLVTIDDQQRGQRLECVLCKTGEVCIMFSVRDKCPPQSPIYKRNLQIYEIYFVHLFLTVF